MASQSERNVVCDTLSPGVRVVRFVRPDLRPQLYDQEAIAECSLYRELDAAALADLPEGEAVVINFGLIDWFPTAFYRLLLKVREAVQARNARLLLCCLTPNVRECFDLMGGGRLFEIRATEANAVSAAEKQGEQPRGKGAGASQTQPRPAPE
jgi:anti-anti-sigma regulatory factor